LNNGTLTFGPGTNNQTITVSVVNDTLIESDETVIVSLSNPANAQLDANAQPHLHNSG